MIERCSFVFILLANQNLIFQNPHWRETILLQRMSGQIFPQRQAQEPHAQEAQHQQRGAQQALQTHHSGAGGQAANLSRTYLRNHTPAATRQRNKHKLKKYNINSVLYRCILKTPWSYWVTNIKVFHQLTENWERTEKCKITPLIIQGKIDGRRSRGRPHTSRLCNLRN